MKLYTTSNVLLLIFSVLIMANPSISSSLRVKRDLVCASGGDRLCSVLCKAKGNRDGECVWDDNNAFDCKCDQELRGIRCNLGGPKTCLVSCVMLGYRTGACDSDRNKCSCSGGRNRWGRTFDNIRSRF